MRSTALDQSIRLLLQACAAASLLVVPGCGKQGADDISETSEDSGDCPSGWESPVNVALTATGTIVAMTRNVGENVAITGDGTLVRFDGWGSESSETIPTSGLRAFVDMVSGVLVVGDGGQILRRPPDATWVAKDSGGAEDLIDIVAADDGAWALAIASNRTIYSTDGGDTWTELPAPEGSWSGLRRVFKASGIVWLIGDGGQVWTSADPSAGWEPFELGSTANLITGDDGGCDDCTVIASADTLHFLGLGTSLPAPDGEVFIALADGYAVTDRAVYAIAPSVPSIEQVRALDFTPTAIAGDWENVFLAGPNGELTRISRFYCLGRPWMIDGEPQIASSSFLATGTASDRWTRDGLYEHASVASFARFVGELLALGSPPALIQAAQAAILDELEHARLCFELAAREHELVHLGPLPLDPHSSARAGDPVALALAVFEEGCLGESIAAIEAGVAAATSKDTDARVALERIAGDERRHAALAWRTLRWLVDEFGAPVREALRGRLAELDTSGSELRVRTLAEVTRPLALALLEPTPYEARC